MGLLTHSSPFFRDSIHRLLYALHIVERLIMSLMMCALQYLWNRKNYYHQEKNVYIFME